MIHLWDQSRKKKNISYRNQVCYGSRITVYLNKIDNFPAPPVACANIPWKIKTKDSITFDCE